MSDKKETIDLIRDIVTAGLIGIVAATIKALMSKNENLPSLIRTFAAGVLLAVLVGYILRGTSISQHWKTIIIASSAAFISTFWPLLETMVKNYVTKKGKNVIKDNDLD